MLMFREDSWSALHEEASQGHDTTVRLLLEKGVEVNAQGGCYGSAQQAAAMAGHDTIVRLILKHGADMNAQGGYYGNALQAAVESDHEAILRLLIRRAPMSVCMVVRCGRQWCMVAMQFAVPKK